jgi:signal transduction histidine kinase/CheY-like chemotaxis protein/HPt (histidine-containing phosphotransfer) domain-containing protein
MSIQGKIISGFLSILILFTTVTLVNLSLSRHVKRAMDEIAESDDIQQDAILLEKQIMDMESGLRGFLLTNNPDFLQSYRKAIPAFKRLMQNQEVAHENQGHHFGGMKKLEADMEFWINNYAEPLIEAKAESLQNRGNQAEFTRLFDLTVRTGEGKKMTEGIKKEFEKISSDLKQEEGAKKTELMNYKNKVDTISWILNCLAAIIAFTISFVIIKSITSRINNMVQFARNFSDGNYSLKIKDTHTDELSIMSKSLNRMASIIEEKMEELHASLSSLDKAKKSQELFFANMSHEIRTPMNGVIGMTDLLLDTNLGPEQSDYVRSIKESSEHLLNIINDLLDFSKLQAGKMVFDKRGTDIREVLNNVILILKAKLEEGQNQVFICSDPDVHPYFVSDPVRLSQVFLNLVGNSAKFTSKGTITIRLHLIREEGDSQTIRFSVSDTGIGIPEEKLPSIFETYTQAHFSSSAQGTGLGLGIVQKVITANGGRIEIESKVNQGTTISFTLKLRKCRKEDVRIQQAVSSDKGGKVLTGIRILVAEDNKMNQKVIKMTLEKYGAFVRVAENGKEALDFLSLQAFDILLLDIRMPVMDGFECIQAIRSNEKSEMKTIPVIALTANAMKEEHQVCIESGMNDYLSKPFNTKELLNRIILLTHPSQIKEDPDLSSSPPCGLGTLERLSGGNKEFVREAIAIYAADMPENMATMKHNLGVGDLKGVRALAHKMKSSASLVDALHLYEILNSIELNENLSQLEMSGLVQQAETELKASIDHLQNQF